MAFEGIPAASEVRRAALGMARLSTDAHRGILNRGIPQARVRSVVFDPASSLVAIALDDGQMFSPRVVYNGRPSPGLFREAVRKASQEHKTQRKLEVSTTESVESFRGAREPAVRREGTQGPAGRSRDPDRRGCGSGREPAGRCRDRPPEQPGRRRRRDLRSTTRTRRQQWRHAVGLAPLLSELGPSGGMR